MRIGNSAALLALSVIACASPAPPQGTTAAKLDAAAHAPSFVEDDLVRAQADARRENKVVVVDVWAPWCHTCLSMRSFVFGDPSLGVLEKDAVFASVDFDKPGSAAFLARHEVESLPTFLVLSPHGEVVARKSGSGSLAEMRHFIEGGVRASREMLKGPDRALLEAGRSRTAGDALEAAKSYQLALVEAPATWPHRGEAALGLLDALHRRGDDDACVARAIRYEDALRGSSIPADAASILLECAEGATVDAPAGKVLAIRLLEGFIAHPPDGASIDDRGDASMSLAHAIEGRGDVARAKEIYAAALAMLEDAAKRAHDTEAAHVFDYQRTTALIALGRGGEAATMLEERERALPTSYEPPARLARAYFATKRHRDAKAAIDRAVARSYGPRRLGYLAFRAEIEDAMGDHAAALATLTEEVAGWRALPEGQASPKKLANAESRLAAAKGPRIEGDPLHGRH